MSNHLIKRGNTWHVKVAIPVDVRAVLGKSQFKQSLKTKDKAEAIARSGPLILRFKRLIKQARRDLTVQLEDYLSDTKVFLRDSRLTHVDEDTIAAIQQEVIDRLLAAHGAQHVEQLSSEAEEKVVHKFKVADGQLTPFDEHLEEYIKSRKVEATTIKKDRHAIPKFALACPMLEDVDKKVVRTFVKKLSTDEELSNATIRANLATLRVYWKWLADEDRVDANMANPFADVQLPSVNRKEAAEDKRLPFTVEDVSKLHGAIEGCRSEQMKATFQIAIYTGCRIEEITSLRKENVTEDLIKIVGAKTTAGNRTIPVHEKLRPLLVELLQGDDPYLIPGLMIDRYGKRSQAMSKRFGFIKRELGFDRRYVFHSLRKTVATQFKQAGVPEGVAADILGHDKPTMTYGVYAGGSSMEQKQVAVGKLDYEF